MLQLEVDTFIRWILRKPAQPPRSSDTQQNSCKYAYRSSVLEEPTNETCPKGRTVRRRKRTFGDRALPAPSQKPTRETADPPPGNRGRAGWRTPEGPLHIGSS